MAKLIKQLKYKTRENVLDDSNDQYEWRYETRNSGKIF